MQIGSQVVADKNQQKEYYCLPQEKGNVVAVTRWFAAFWLGRRELESLALEEAVSDGGTTSATWPSCGAQSWPGLCATAHASPLEHPGLVPESVQGNDSRYLGKPMRSNYNNEYPASRRWALRKRENIEIQQNSTEPRQVLRQCHRLPVTTRYSVLCTPYIQFSYSHPDFTELEPHCNSYGWLTCSCGQKKVQTKPCRSSLD